MPKAKKTAAKTSAARKKTARKKPALKMAHAKKPAKKTQPIAAKKMQSSAHPHTNPMWKLLEEKESRRKHATEEAHNLHGKHSDYGTKMPAQQSKFSRFAGPRRRAA